MNENVVVKITNISDFDFTSDMGAMYGGVAYPLPAGGSMLVPSDLGKHLAKHLARQIIIRQAPLAGSNEDNSAGTLMTEEAEQALIAKIVSDAYTEEKAPVKTQDQVLQDKVAQMNQEAQTETAPAEYQDKAQVIDELNKRGIKFDARKGKAALEALLKE